MYLFSVGFSILLRSWKEVNSKQLTLLDNSSSNKIVYYNNT